MATDILTIHYAVFRTHKLDHYFHSGHPKKLDIKALWLDLLNLNLYLACECLMVVFENYGSL